MLARLRVEVIRQRGRAGHQLLHLGVLAVENAQRIAFQAPLAVGIEAALVAAEILHQQLAISPASFGGAERVDLQAYPLDTEVAPQTRRERDQLSIDVGTGVTNRLEIDLVELAVPARLRQSRSGTSGQHTRACGVGRATCGLR